MRDTRHEDVEGSPTQSRISPSIQHILRKTCLISPSIQRIYSDQVSRPSAEPPVCQACQPHNLTCLITLQRFTTLQRPSLITSLLRRSRRLPESSSAGGNASRRTLWPCTTSFRPSRRRSSRHILAQVLGGVGYRGTSLIRKRPLGPSTRTMPRALGGS